MNYRLRRNTYLPPNRSLQLILISYSSSQQLQPRFLVCRLFKVILVRLHFSHISLTFFPTHSLYIFHSFRRYFYTSISSP